MLNTRRIARELALLTMAQIANRSEKTPLSLGEMVGRAADMLATEAHDRIKEAAASLAQSEHVLHEHYLEMTESHLKKADLETALGALDKAQEAVELIGSALELPAMVALAGAEEVREFAIAMVARYTDHKAAIEQKLEAAAENWKVERMAAIDRDLMRLAIAELLWEPSVPVEVAINEAVELAKKYGTPDSGRFVNGVLSRFAEEGTQLREGKPNVV